MAEGLWTPSDINLDTNQIEQKYSNRDLIKAQAQAFSSLSFDEQSEWLKTALTGKLSDKAVKVDDTVKSNLINHRVVFYQDKLKSLGKLDEWIEKTCSNKIFKKLPIEEKEKYHNALIAFHHECMKNSASSSQKVLDSPPTSQEGEAFDFDDSSKWEKINE